MAVVHKNGREAVTHYRVLKHFPKGDDPRLFISMVECKLATGRTHQIRVHLHHLGHPLLGDKVYGHVPKGAKKIWQDEVIHFPRQALHAQALQFIHPRSGEKMSFEAPLSVDMEKLIELF